MNEILENKKLKEFPFDIPEGYFSSLEERVRSRMEVEKEGKKVALWRTLRASLALAGAFILIIAVGSVILKNSTGWFQKSSETIAEETSINNIEDSLQTLLLAEQVEDTIINGDNAENVYDQIITGTEDLSQIENLEEYLSEYLDNMPTAYHYLIAEDIR